MNLSIKQAVHIMERDGHLGLNRRLVRLFMRIVSHCLVRVSLLIRKHPLANVAVLIRARNKHMKHRDRAR